MKKSWIIIVIAIILITVLYIIEYSKIEYSGNQDMANLDGLDFNHVAKEWEPFYRVRATIIDGQSARFSIPDELLKKEGKKIELTGAAVFYGNGCERSGDQITVSDFFLIPSLGLAEACVIQPDIEMRWTVRINLKNDWKIHYEEMISMMARVKGRFRIDTSNPYESVFFIDDAVVEIFRGEETNS